MQIVEDPLISQNRPIRMGDTDATGRIFFPKAFEIALETLEIFFEKKDFFLRDFLFSKNYQLPIVNASVDFFYPLRLGDQMEVKLFISKIGNSSLEFFSHLFLPKIEKICAKVSITHVLIDATTYKSISLPSNFRAIFSNEK